MEAWSLILKTWKIFICIFPFLQPELCCTRAVKCIIVPALQLCTPTFSLFDQYPRHGAGPELSSGSGGEGCQIRIGMYGPGPGTGSRWGMFIQNSRPGVSGHSSQLEWRMALFRYIYHRFIEIPTIPFCYLNIAHTSVNGNPGVTLSHLHGDRDTFSLIFISILSIWLWSSACCCCAVRLIISIDSSAGGCCGVRKHSVREEAF